MPSIFGNVDFGFRYGSRAAVRNAGIENGTFNIATDVGELYIDISGVRLPINDVFSYSNEYEIRALLEPAENKLYFARDSKRFLSYDFENLEWEYVTIDAAALEERFLILESVVNAINSFEISIVEELPDEGESHIIYFVPQENSDEDTLYDEFLWIENPGYFEKIGITRADLNSYYTKTEADEIFSTKANTVSDIGFNSTTGYITKSINGVSSDTIAVSDLFSKLTSSQVTTALGFTPSGIINEMSAEEALAGTSTTAKTVSAKTLRDLVDGVTSGSASDAAVQALSETVAELEETITTLQGRISALEAISSYDGGNEDDSNSGGEEPTPEPEEPEEPETPDTPDEPTEPDNPEEPGDGE